MDGVLALLREYKYLAMFGILCLCGVGLPVPEELTLLAGGFAVGWQWADYSLSCLWCTLGILAGDSAMFWTGRHFGRPFFASRPLRLLLPERRQASVRQAFVDHGNKTVFFARFVSGFRIGVYAYAGQHGMKWRRFLLLDLLGCAISVPVIVLLGKVAACELADPREAALFARELLRDGYTALYILLAIVILSIAGHSAWNRFVARRAGLKAPDDPGPSRETRVDESEKSPAEEESGALVAEER